MFTFYFVFCRECGWRNSDSLSTCPDPCVVCLERKCTVAAKGNYDWPIIIISSSLSLFIKLRSITTKLERGVGDAKRFSDVLDPFCCCNVSITIFIYIIVEILVQCNKNLQDPPQKMGKGLMCIHTYIQICVCLLRQYFIYIYLITKLNFLLKTLWTGGDTDLDFSFFKFEQSSFRLDC